MSAPSPPGVLPAPNTALLAASLTLAYLVAAWLGQGLAASPWIASPIWPAAGLATGALVGGGMRLWPSVFLGVLLFEAAGAPSLRGVGVGAIIASGCTLQALLGAWLTRDCFRPGAPLRDRDLAALLLQMGPVACVVGATIGLARPLAAAGAGADLWGQWLTWWCGDSLGVLLVAPVVICSWPGSPCGVRVARSLTLPLLLLAGVLVGVHAMVNQAEKAEAREVASEHLDAVEDAVVPTVQAMLRPFFGVEGLLSASDDVTPEQFSELTERARASGLTGILWAPRVLRAARAGFEAAEGLTIAERSAAGLLPATPREEYFPVLFSAPADRPTLPLGLDCASEVGLCGLEGVRRGAEAVIAEAMRMDTGRLAVPVVLPVFRSVPGVGPGAGDAQGALRGFVVGFYDVDFLFASLKASAERGGMVYTVTDVTPGQPPMPLLEADSGPDGVLTRGRDFHVGARTWHLDIALPGGAPVAVSPKEMALLLLSVVFAFVGSFASLGIATRSAASLAAERLTRGTLDALSANIAVLDSQGTIVTTNRSWRDFAEQNGLDPVTVFPGANYLMVCERAAEAGDVDAGEVLNGIRDVMAGRIEEYVHDYPCHSPTEERWFCCRVTRSDLGGELRVVIAHEAITVVKRAQREASRAQRRAMDLFESAHDAILITNRRGTILQANARAEAMFCWSRAELVGQSIEILMPDGGRAAHARHREGFDKHPTPRVMGVGRSDLVALRRDGSTFPVEISLSPIESEDGSVAASIRDVTERVAAERALRESLERYHGTLDAMMEGALILDFDWRCLYANEAAVRHCGVPAAKLLGRTLLDALPGIERLPWFPALERCQRDRVGQNREVRYLRPDGTTTCIRLSMQPVPEGLFILSMDITDQAEAAERQAAHQMELERERSALADRVLERTAELSAANSALARARDAAEEATRAKSTFLATMSHEIRTPMNGVVGLVEVLMNSNLSPDHAEIAGTIRDSAFSLLGVVDDILDFSKIEAGRLDLEHTPVALSDLVEGVCASLLPLAASAGVEMLLFVDPALPFAVWSDPTRLRQILNNVVGNAIKFSGGRACESGTNRGFGGRRAPPAEASGGRARESGTTRGRVMVRVELAPGSRMRIEVADNGIGMSEEVQARLFEPFAQGEASTTRRFGGTGLGLVICKRLVALMCGEISVRSTLGEGSTFTTLLPLVAAPDEARPAGPDLAGVDCVILGDTQADDLGRYLLAAGANVRHAATESDSAAWADGLTNAVLVHGSASIPPAGPSFRRVRVSMSPPGELRVEPAVVTVSGRAMRRSAFLRAVAVAAGRETGEGASLPGRAASQSPADVESARARGRLILVVEDDAVSRKVMQLQLALLGYAAEFAVDGVDALNRWRDGGFGLVFTDLHMPGMDGYALVDAIRREEAGGAPIPVVALTANALIGEAARAHAAGMQEYLTKPLQLESLRTTIARWLF